MSEPIILMYLHPTQDVPQVEEKDEQPAPAAEEIQEDEEEEEEGVLEVLEDAFSPLLSCRYTHSLRRVFNLSIHGCRTLTATRASMVVRGLVGDCWVDEQFKRACLKGTRDFIRPLYSLCPQSAFLGSQTCWSDFFTSARLR